MRNERDNLKAGLFIVFSIAAVIAIVVAIKGVGRVLEPHQTRTVTFKLTDDVGGLNDGDDVRLGGLKVGTVRRIDFATGADGEPRIAVTFTLPQRIDLRPDAKIAIQSTVTGASNLNIEHLGSGAAIAEAEPADPEALVGQAGALSRLLAAMGEVAPDLSGTVRDVRTVTLPKVNNAVDRTTETVATFKTTGETATDLIRHVKGKVDPAVERYNTVAESGRSALDNLSSLLGDTKVDFRTTIANLAAATGTVKQNLPGIMERLDDALAKMQTAIDSTNVALEDVKQIAANTREASAGVRSLLVSNRSRIDAMVASLKTTGDNLKSASAEIRRSPWRLLYKPGPGEMANLNLFDSAREFAEGANDLNDAASALRDALQDPDVPPEQVQKLIDRLDQTFGRFNDVERQLWQKVK